MKSAFHCSVLLNLVLVGALVAVWTSRQNKAGGTAPPAVSSAEGPAPAPVTAPPPPRMVSRPFRWSDLFSTNDYREYLANLRAIGCPEATIRAIAAADVHEAFAARHRESRSSAGGASSWTSREETNMVANLMEAPARPVADSTPDGGASPVSNGSQAGPQTEAGSSVAAPSAVPAYAAKQAAATYPAAFQINLDEPSLPPTEKALIKQLQQQFVDAIGGPNQNPRDPAYMFRWKAAQQQVDDVLRGRYGNPWYLGVLQQQYYDSFAKFMQQQQAQQPQAVQ